MAGIIFNIEEAVQNSAFNVLQEPVKFILENEVEAFEKSSIIPKVFVMRTTDKYREEFRSTTAMDGFKPTEDMEPAGLVDFEEGYSKQFVFQTWTAAFIVSKQTMEDKQLGDVNPKALGFIKSYGRTREQYAVRVIGSALGNVYEPYKITAKHGLGMDTVDGTLDGTKQQYFHKAHKTVKLKGETESRATQSNKFYVEGLDFTGADGDIGDKIMDIIGQVKSKMNKYVDDKGNIVPCNPTKILMAEDYRLHDTLVRAMKSKYGISNDTNNAFQPFEIIVSPYLSAVPGFTDEDHGIILIDPDRNREGMGAVWFDRKPLEVDSYIDKKSKANVWDGRARFGAGFGDFRAMSYIKLNGKQSADDATATKLTAQTATVKNVKVVNSTSDPVNTKEAQ